jgi:hypothetical protein
MIRNTLLAALLIAFSMQGHAASHDGGCDGLTQTAIDAALGEPLATYNLGVYFYAGRCVRQDYSNAATLWETAAGFGIADAKNNLAFLLSEGRGVNKDPARAVRLWTEAARAGEDEAQVHLGHALFHGDGVDQDRTRGLAWVLRAIGTTPDGVRPDVRAKVLEMAEREKAAMLELDPALLAGAVQLEPEVDVAPPAADAP